MTENEKNTLINDLLLEYVKQNTKMKIDLDNEAKFKLNLEKSIKEIKAAYDAISEQVNKNF